MEQINKLRKEITQLINNIKEHSDYLTSFERLPQVEMEMILLKIKKLYEKAIIFDYEYEQEMLTRRVKPATPEKETNLENETKAYIAQNKPEMEASPIEKTPFEEDKPEKKVVEGLGEKEGMVEDRPAEKLVKEQPGEHIFEKAVEKKTVEEKATETEKAELHEKLKNTSKSGSLHERIGQSQIYSSLSNKLQMNPISDLNKAIGINEKFLYAKELFQNKQPDFAEALNRLNNFKNFAEAEQFLFVELAPKYNWDKTSEVFGKFMELVQRRYL